MGGGACWGEGHAGEGRDRLAEVRKGKERKVKAGRSEIRRKEREGRRIGGWIGRRVG